MTILEIWRSSNCHLSHKPFVKVWDKTETRLWKSKDSEGGKKEKPPKVFLLFRKQRLTSRKSYKLPGVSVRDPARGKGHEEGSLTKHKGGDQASGVPPGISWASNPQIRVCLLDYIMLFTYSSGINRALSPHHLFLGKS